MNPMLANLWNLIGTSDQLNPNLNSNLVYGNSNMISGQQNIVIGSGNILGSSENFQEGPVSRHGQDKGKAKN